MATTHEPAAVGVPRSDSGLLMGIDVGDHTSVVATGTAEMFAQARSGEGSSAIKKAYVPSCVSFDGKLVTYGVEAESRVNFEPKDTILNLPMWLSVQEVGAARELEDRIGFCPYPHVTIDQGKVIFRVSFDDNDTRVPLPLALGFFLQHLQDKGNASQQSPLEHDVAPLVRGLSRSLRVFSRDAADSEITPPAMAAIALPSSVTPRAIRVAEAAAKLAGLTAKFLRRIDALVNFWAFENLPQDYRPLLELQKKLGVTPKTDGAVHVVLLDVGFSETSVAVLEIGRPESDSDVEHQPQQDVVCKSLCVEVDPALGFVDVVVTLLRHVVAHLQKRYGVEIKSHSRKCWRLHLACIRAIRELTDLPESVIDMENFVIEHTDLRMDCTRKHLEGLCTPLKERFKQLFEKAFYRADIDPRSVVAVDVCGASGAARLPWLVDVIEEFFGCTHKEHPELSCKIRRTLETTAAAAIGAAYYCHGGRYVQELREPEELVLYGEEELKDMAAVRDELIETEAKELKRRAMRAKLQLYLHELRSLVDHPKREADDSADEGHRLLQDIEATLANVSTQSHEDVKNLYNEVRSYFAEHHSRVSDVIEKPSHTENQRKRDMVEVLNQLEGEAATKLTRALCIRRAKQDYREALTLIEGGQYELSSYLLSRGLDLLGRINLTELSEDDAKDVAELKASLYIQLAKSECCQADEDGAIDARRQLLADVIKNCTKALGINKSHAEAYLYRARAHMKLGDYTEADKDAASGRILNPDDQNIKKIQDEVATLMSS